MIRPSHREMIKKSISRLDSSFFYYNLDFLKEHLEYISSHLDKDIKLWYACKANPLSAILKVLRNLDFGIDVASIGEMNQVLSSGVKPSEILSTGPGKTKNYLKELLKNDIEIIVLESFNQAYWLDEVAKELGKKPKCLLRVQLDWDEGRSVLGGDDITPFGIGLEDWPKLDKSKTENLNIVGFHVFQWGNILDLSKLESVWWKTAEVITKLSKIMNVDLEVIDLGGGLGIPYNGKSEGIDFKDVADLLKKLKKEFKFKKIWMELGRYTVGECGHYFSKVIDRKTVRGKEIVVLSGGINHIARIALVGESFPCELFRETDAKKIPIAVHGPLCTAIDKLGEFELPDDIKPGDWLYFSQAGAYGFTEAMPFFLCHDLPAEVVIYNDDLMVPRPIKTSTDWLV